MTEEEAQKKLCPYMTEFMASAGNGSPFCFGRACMAWQPYESASFKAKAEYVFRREGKNLVSNEGYCSRGAKPSDAPRQGEIR